MNRKRHMQEHRSLTCIYRWIPCGRFRLWTGAGTLGTASWCGSSSVRLRPRRVPLHLRSCRCNKPRGRRSQTWRTGHRGTETRRAKREIKTTSSFLTRLKNTELLHQHQRQPFFLFRGKSQLLPSLSRGSTLSRLLSDQWLVGRNKRGSNRWPEKHNMGVSYAKRNSGGAKKVRKRRSWRTSASASTKEPRGDRMSLFHITPLSWSWSGMMDWQLGIDLKSCTA